MSSSASARTVFARAWQRETVARSWHAAARGVAKSSLPEHALTLPGPTSPGPFLLGIERRLPDKAAFDHVFAAPDLRLRRHPFSLLARRSTLESARLGLVIGKKHARRAVDRNRLRRILREQFRLSLLPCCDIIVMARPGAALAARDDLHEAAIWLFDQASKKIADAKPC